MEAVLVYPRWNYPTFGELQEPLGLLYIGAMLKAQGHRVTMTDLAVDDIALLDAALERADLVGLSSSTALYGRACLVLDRIKEKRPDLPVILGGPHATVLPEDAVARGFDAAVIGEGEHTAVELAAAISRGESLHHVPGVVTRFDDGFVRGPDRPFEPDLDSFPDPDRTLVDYQKYFDKKLTHVGMMATRGCPWNCLFCKPMQDKLFGRKVRRRGLRRIVAEMKWIRDHVAPRPYVFKDDTLVLAGTDWFIEFERELKDAGMIGISFSCQSRVDQITKPLLAQMKRCGLEGIAFGVESGSQKVLDFYRKSIKVEETIRAFDLCHEMAIGTHAFIMLGAPVETRDDLEATVRLVERIKTESVSVSLTTPAPGSDLYTRMKESGMLTAVNPEDFDYLYNRAPVNHPHLTVKDLAWAERAILDLTPTTFFKDELESRMITQMGDLAAR
ncbi:MAG TPA: radical SAM protein [bacterium]|nr:radical SAM protein [bacterium]